jgi:23S rRNA (guanosine2251-2'-O)-methyltransferase
MSLYIYGFQPVIEALKQKPQRIDTIFLAKEIAPHKKEKLLELARKKRLSIRIKPRQFLDNLIKKYGTKSIHQGVIAFLKEFNYSNLEDIMDAKLLLALDHIQDPQNLGNIIRTAFIFGVGGIILPKDRASPITPTVIKTSAGAAILFPIVRVTNLAHTLDWLKEAGFWIGGMVVSGATAVWDLEIEFPFILVAGHEHKGISPLIRKKCDFLLSVPMQGSLNSLNVSVATAICLYEIFKKHQRHV